MSKALTDIELTALVDGELRQSIGYFGGRLANMRQQALVYYEGLPKGDLAPPEIEGRSSVIATEVRNVIESMLPELMAKFSSSERVVELEETKPQDEQAAKDASEYLNYVFYKKNNGHRILETAFKDALISKSGIVKCWWDTRTEESKEDYRGLTDVELSEILDDEEVEPIAHESYSDEEAEEQKAQALQQAQAQFAQVQGNPQAMMQLQGMIQGIEAQPIPSLHNVTVKRTKKGGKIAMEAVPPEEFLVSRKAKSLEDAPFVAHRIVRTQSELKSMGYKDVDNITSEESSSMLSMERVERLTWDDDMSYLTQTDLPSYDPSQRLIVLYECYLRVDVDGDGIAELRKITKAGNQILDNEEVDAIPFVVFRPILMPHRFFGLSVADLAIEPQRVKTSILRSMLDNLYLQVNGRYYAVEGQVNLDDLLTSRPGGVVRMKQVGMAGRLDQSSADLADSMQMLQYMQGFTEEATGWNRVANAADNPDSLNETATKANIVANKAQMRLDLIARNFAEGLVDLFKLMLKYLTQHQDAIEDVKLGGRWVKLDPREWRNQFQFNINVGLGTGSKDQQVQHLSMLIQHQGQQLAAGLPTVTPANIYQSSKKLAEALGYKNADAFFVDPAQQPPRPQQPNPELIKIQAQQQADQAKLQLDAQKHQAEIQADMQLEQFRQQVQAEQVAQQNQLQAQREAMQARLTQEIETMKAQQQMALEQYKIEQQTQASLAIEKLKAETAVVVAQMNAQKGVEGAPMADTTNALAAALQGFQAALEQMRAPRTIVRGADGRAVGIQ